MPYFDSYHERSNCMIATRQSLVVLCWTDVASAEAVDDLRKAFERAATNKDPILFVTYLEDAALSRHTPADFREALAKLLTDFGEQMGAGVIVLEKAGFKGAMLRAIVSTIGLLSGAKFPVNVHSDLQDATTWLLKRTGVAGHSPDLITEAVQRIRTKAA